MRTMVVASLVAALAFPAAAAAREYGDAGTIDVTGGLEIGSTSTTLEEKDTETEIEDTNTIVGITPSVIWYPIDGLGVLGSISMDSNSDTRKVEGNDETTNSTTSFELGVGAGYLFKVGKVRMGPALTLKIANQSTTSDDGTDETTEKASGAGFELAAVIKLPVGTGGVVTTGLFLESLALTTEPEDGPEDELSKVSLGMFFGVGIYF